MNIGLKKLLTITGVGTVCAVVLRILQIVFMTEAKTGFFIKGFGVIGNAVTAAIILIIAVCTIYGATYKEKQVQKAVITKPFGIVHFVLAIAIVYESLFSTISANTQAWKILLQMVFGLSAALVFALQGYRAYTGEDSSRALSVVYILFWLVRLIITFSTYISASVLAETVFELLALCTALVFFFNSSALENGVSEERRKKVLLPSAIAAILSGAVYSVSQAIIILSGKSQLLHTQNASLITNAVLTVYVLFYVVLSFRKPNEETPIEEPEEEIIDEI